MGDFILRAVVGASVLGLIGATIYFLPWLACGIFLTLVCAVFGSALID